jgi:hypothetical protein
MPKDKNENTIRHILFDCDGCVSEPKQGSKFTNEYLFKKLRDENEQYDLNVLGSFSSRQSITVENLNKEEHGDNSFTYFNFIARYNLDMPYDPTTLSDVRGNNYPYGWSQALIISGQYNQDKHYTPAFRFDEYKTSMLYFKAHDTVNRSVGCDFLVIHDFNEQWRSIYALYLNNDKLYDDNRLVLQLEKDLKQVHFRSNAAYVYFKEKNIVFHVNKIKKETRRFDLTDTQHIDWFIASNYADESTSNYTYKPDDYDFEIPLSPEKTTATGETKISHCTAKEHHKRLCGITLNKRQLTLLTQAIAHDAHFRLIDVKHRVNDNLIQLDIYDDRSDIISNLLAMNTDRIPNNVKINVYQYANSNQNHKYGELFEGVSDFQRQWRQFSSEWINHGRQIGTLSGTGPLDLNPGNTLDQLQSRTLNHNNTDFSHNFKREDLSDEQKKIFSSRKVRNPQVGKPYQPYTQDHSDNNSLNSFNKCLKVGALFGAVLTGASIAVNSTGAVACASLAMKGVLTFIATSCFPIGVGLLALSVLCYCLSNSNPIHGPGVTTPPLST